MRRNSLLARIVSRGLPGPAGRRARARALGCAGAFALAALTWVDPQVWAQPAPTPEGPVVARVGDRVKWYKDVDEVE